MLFRRRSPSDNIVTAQFPNPKSGHFSPSNVSILSYRPPESIGEALAPTEYPPRPPPHYSKTPGNPRHPHPLERSQSSEYFLEIRKSPGPKEPQSRKTNFTTIRTDATETQPAFESDAFAIQMPTTREPILDAPVFRAKIPSPSKGQVEAYQTYKQKAQQVRERNNSEGVRVPSKIVSYDYAYASRTAPLEVDVEPPASPRQHLPAGSFPISPPLTQYTWSRAKREAQSIPTKSESISIPVTQKSVIVEKGTSPILRTRQPRADTVVGASSRVPPAATPAKIRVRIKPRAVDSPQKDAKRDMYNGSPQSSTDGGGSGSSRSASPSKPMPNFAYTTAGDSVFGYANHSISGTQAVDAAAKAGMKEKETTPKRTLTSRWNWLKPAGPRVAKPVATVVPPAKPPKAAAYIDPFVLHASPLATKPNTPATSRPVSPRKLARAAVPILAAPKGLLDTPKGKFESGFAQVKSLALLILKVCLLVYALVGLYFLLDAIREAVHALGAPFRVLRWASGYAWVGAMYAVRLLAKCWDRWGLKIAVKGGWRGKWW